VSISSIFWAQLFCTKVFYTAFLYLHFGFEFFWQKNINKKAAQKILMKLTKGRNRGSKQSKKNRKDESGWSGLKCFLVCHVVAKTTSTYLLQSVSRI